MNREAIHQALFQRLGAVPGLLTLSRRLRHWSDVAAAEQPALFQVQKSETALREAGLPPRWRFAVDLFLYARAADEQSPASAVLNPLLDAIEAALAPDPGRTVQDLGGLVAHCWIAGKVETDEGVLGSQAVAILPVEILLA